MRPSSRSLSSVLPGSFRTLAFALFLPFVMLCSASTASAIPVVITGGSAGTALGNGNFGIGMTGANFSFSAHNGFAPRGQVCGPCLPGMQFGGTISATNMNVVTAATYNGTDLRNANLVHTYNNFFTTPVFTIPLDLSPVVLPFTYQGVVSVTPRDGSPQYFFELTGEGTATFTFVQGAGRVLGQVTYAFAPPQPAPQPAPEPATVLLLGTGLAGGVIARLRRRRRE